jgi:predicted permease
MQALFEDRLAAARRVGTVAAAAVWMRATVDILAAHLDSNPCERVQLTIPVDERNSIMAGSDIRYAWRALLRQRGASALVIVMLALGIAVNVAVFSLVNGLFLRPFPFPHPDRLAYINTAAPKWNLDVVGINYPDFAVWQKDQKLFDAITMYESENFNLADGGGAERIRGARITYDYPKVFGVAPVLGRSFTADEDRPKAPPVVVISEALWRERFGSDPNITSRTLRLNGVARSVIGVMPARAAFPDDVRLWVPYAGDPAQPYESYSGDGIGRMKPGVTVEQADADIKRAHQPIWDTREKQRIVTPFVRPLHETFVRDYRGATKTIAGAVVVLLLIACANVAAVMLARALARRREMGIRLALGSTRLRLLRQLLVENLMLAAAGGAIGLVAGQWALAALLSMVPDQLPAWAAFRLDARVAAFSVLIVVVTVILFGWAPGLHAVAGDLRSAVNATTNGTTAAPRGRRTLWALVGGEFALAAVLLVCGLLLFKAFDRVRHVDPGFRSDHVLLATIPLSDGTRPEPRQWLSFWSDLERRVAGVPGVDASGFITCAPLSGCHTGNFFRPENALPQPEGKNPVVLWRTASPGYAAAMGLRLNEGRFLEERDSLKGAAPVLVVNETFVRTFWGDGVKAVGRRVRQGDNNVLTIVGVTADVKHYGLEVAMRPGVYLPMPLDPRTVMMLAVHTTVEPTSIVPSLRDVLRQMDPEVPLYRVKTMDQQIRQSMAMRAAFSWMLAVFAGLAFVLAIGGAYGVAMYLVTQRTREIGIRVALGARTRDIFRGVVAAGLGVVAGGVAVGVLGALVVARQLGDALFGVNARDPGVLAIVVVVLLATALVANGLPARRAARIDPMRSLRTDG